MDNLQQQIDNLKTLQESYDAVAQAAEAYNTGKTELAQNITAKGVPASADETLPELAEKVSAITQETYEINGGEMYAKQLFGSLETPNYWNLYEVLEQLLSDGRLVNYGGILLAEYYKGYDSLALAGAGAGGAYVVSDKDSQGNFIMYTNDTTHVWNDDLNGKGDRWVAYCFAEEYHNFDITDTNTSPRSIFIGRKVGTIATLVNSRISQIVVPDGNSLGEFNSNGYSNMIGQKFSLRNVVTISSRIPLVNTESVYVEADKISCSAYTGALFSSPSINNVVIKANELRTTASDCSILGDVNIKTLIVDAEKIIAVYLTDGILRVGNISHTKEVILLGVEEMRMFPAYANDFSFNVCLPDFERIYIGYKDNDRSRSVDLALRATSYQGPTTITDIELQDGWMKPLSLFDYYKGLTEENIVNHILNRLGDNSGQSPLTITLGATNLAKLTAEEIAIATNKGFTLA